MSKARKAKNAGELATLMAAHAQARAALSRLVDEEGKLVDIPKSLTKEVCRAYDRHAQAFRQLCRYEPRDASELNAWLVQLLSDELIADRTILVLDGIEAYHSASRCLTKLLIPANAMQSR